jgi:L-lactate dehydrogenase complex protein LldG
MSDERTLLGRITAELRREPRDRTAAQPLDAPPRSGSRPGEIAAPVDHATLVARFRAEWEALAGHVQVVRSEHDALDAVVAICRAHAASQVITWAGAAMGFPSLEERLGAAGIEADLGWVPDDADARAARLNVLSDIQVGITGADALLAESGSVVVVSGRGRSRLASLLPPVHITLARTNCVHQSLQHLFEADPSLADRGSNLVAISGPSRTADIEMTLTRGVHGPGDVYVILIED